MRRNKHVELTCVVDMSIIHRLGQGLQIPVKGKVGCVGLVFDFSQLGKDIDRSAGEWQGQVGGEGRVSEDEKVVVESTHVGDGGLGECWVVLDAVVAAGDGCIGGVAER